MTTIGGIIIVVATVFALHKIQSKFDDLEYEIFQLKEKLKEKGIIEK